jgi:hypothetical protein
MAAPILSRSSASLSEGGRIRQPQPYYSPQIRRASCQGTYSNKPGTNDRLSGADKMRNRPTESAHQYA